MLKEVKSFKTSDGKLHESRLSALLTERTIEIRAIFNKDSNKINKVEADYVQCILNNINDLSSVMQRYNKMIKNERSKANPQPNVARNGVFVH